jgi:hypothetical protein
MDDIERLLLEKYQLPPDHAKALANDVRKGIQQVPGVANDDIKREVMTNAGAQQIRNLDEIADFASTFKELHARKLSGGQTSEEEEKWYSQVLSHHQKKLAAQGQAASKFADARLQRTADTELERMATMLDYGKSFVNGASTQSLSATGMNMVPKGQPEYDTAARIQLTGPEVEARRAKIEARLGGKLDASGQPILPGELAAFDRNRAREAAPSLPERPAGNRPNQEHVAGMLKLAEELAKSDPKRAAKLRKYADQANAATAKHDEWADQIQPIVMKPADELLKYSKLLAQPADQLNSK